ncbi:MAG: hypothetical protein ABIO29_08800 [Sphingomicrobium sp.]
MEMLLIEYWWAIPVALIAAILLYLLLRPRQRVTLTDSAPIRPHMAALAKSEGRGLAAEVAAAASDVSGEIIGADVHRNLASGGSGSDDLVRLKGVGPKMAQSLIALGFTRFDQIAKLNPTALDRLDQQLGAFRGRLARDRVVEQADYLARDDRDGFEQKFGKL